MYNGDNLRHKYTKCQDYKKVFKTEEGEAVLYDLMKQSSFLQSTYTPGDSHATSLNEGMRRLFLYILQQIEADPSTILERIRVQKERDNKDRENIYANVD